MFLDMRFKQIFGSLLLLGFLGFLGYKLLIGLSFLDDIWLTSLLILILLLVIFMGLSKILSD